ncbi:MAG: arginase family protein, partial [Bdellovibrionales bacterium]|nr:arginase family protein [Bdellovibrionales bacterium]
MIQFDPSLSASPEFGIFGIPCKESEAKLILVPVPWEVTTSYGAGASLGPSLIRNASSQIDLFDLETGKSYEHGYFMQDIPQSLLEMNDQFKLKAQQVISLRTNMSTDSKKIDSLCSEINQ